jgi:caffeoyl-CoA O-methyltransferase
MSRLVAEEVESYAEEHTTQPPSFLVRLADETRTSLPVPQMLTGTVEGRLLELLVHATGAGRVLEIGTYSGYSALSMAAALAPGGSIVTCEIDPERAAFARRHIEASPYAERIELRVGPALETIRELEGPLDLVFIDADKANYANYYEAVLPLLAHHGLIVVDNTLWGGAVLESGGSADTRAIKAFNDALARDPRVTCVLLTVRDGVTLIARNASVAS